MTKPPINLFGPQIASQTGDSSQQRISKTLSLILKSKYSVHDLSRIRSEKPRELYRLNMPTSDFRFLTRNWGPGCDSAILNNQRSELFGHAQLIFVVHEYECRT